MATKPPVKPPPPPIREEGRTRKAGRPPGSKDSKPRKRAGAKKKKAPAREPDEVVDGDDDDDGEEFIAELTSHVADAIEGAGGWISTLEDDRRAEIVAKRHSRKLAEPLTRLGLLIAPHWLLDSGGPPPVVFAAFGLVIAAGRVMSDYRAMPPMPTGTQRDAGGGAPGTRNEDPIATSNHTPATPTEPTTREHENGDGSNVVDLHPTTSARGGFV